MNKAKKKYTNKYKSKDARWDRIRKRHLNSLNVKTETIKKFTNIDFIGKKYKNILYGYTKPFLNPQLVMDLRHEIIKDLREKPDRCVKKEVTESRKLDNRFEKYYIENELRKFKANIKKIKPKPIIKPKLCLDLKNEKAKIVSPKSISLSEFEENEGHFCIENEKRCSGIHLSTQSVDRLVRFEEYVHIISYSPEECDSYDSNEQIHVIPNVIANAIEEIKKEENDEQYKEIKAGMTKNLNVDMCNDEKSDEINELLNIATIESLETSHMNFFIEIHTDNEEQYSANTASSDSCSQKEICLFSRNIFNSGIFLKKYFLKWIHFTTIEKIEKQNFLQKSNRIRTINEFLDKIKREKNRIFVTNNESNGESKENFINISKKYQKRIKTQQDIIDLQKIKLKQQEHVIMELKLSRLSDENRQAKKQLKQELRTVIKTSRNNKQSKAKTLQFVADLREADDDDLSRLQGKALMLPKYLIKMQERAMERSIRHEEAKEKRLILQAEREAAKHAAEEAKRLEDEETKRQRINMLKEKRRQEKLMKAQRERDRLHWIENNKKAMEFNRFRILRSVGIACFKQILKQKRKNQRKAETFGRNKIKNKVLNIWKSYTKNIWETKIQEAFKFYKKMLKRYTFSRWRLYIADQHSKYLVAIDWHDYKLSEITLQHWLGQMKLEKVIEENKMKQSESHYNWQMKWKILDHWQRLPQILKIEKETEQRRQRWRLKIWELLPDYTPNTES